MVIVAIPGERWEVERMDAAGIEVERFRSDGIITGQVTLVKLDAFAV
jgi:hypothetical protein